MEWYYTMKRKNKVYVLGSINIDLVVEVDYLPKAGETLKGKQFLRNLGGKGANQAISARRLGCDTTLIASVGNDPFGKEALTKLNDSLINTTKIELSNSDTGMAFITRHEAENRIILYPGANHEMDEKRAMDALNGTQGDLLVTQFEIPYEIVYNGLKKAKSLGMTTVLNPAPATKIGSEIYACVDYLIVNQTECEILSGIYPNSLEDVLVAKDYFIKKGVKKLIVTLGSKGSIYVSSDQIIEQKAFFIKPVDTTGAGDSYVGGIAYGLLNELTMKETLEIASACGAYATQKEGVYEAIGNHQQIMKFMEERK